MPTMRVPFGRRRVALVTFQEDWKPGDQPPKDKSDYLGWTAWADVQHQAGLRAKQCGRCSLWFFPQELSDKIDRNEMKDRRGNVVRVASLVCKTCDRVK